jgi:tetratricopeptide (TPR) repeat protein
MPDIMLRYILLTSLHCTAILMLCTLLMSENVEAASITSRYSIVLASAPGENLKWEPKKSHLFEDYTVYVEQVTIKGSPWERLCLGFFSPRKDASSMLKEVQKIYPGAWITKVSTKNILPTVYSPTGPIATVSTSSAAAKREKPLTGNTSSLTEKQLDSLMQRAKTDFKNKNYASATRYLKALVAAGEHRYSQEALELLGLARQRKGQRSHAIDTYKKYLKLYPESEGAPRVKQRLTGLLTATSAPRKKLEMSASGDTDGLDLTTYGSLYQVYQNNRVNSNDSGSITSLSQLFTHLDVSSLARSNNFDYQFQFTADHVADFVDSASYDSRFFETFIDFSYRKTGSSARVGRQKLPISGILRRFDGVSAGYQFTPDFRLNVLAGFPVDLDNHSSINNHKSIYGFTFETGTFLKHWDMNLFYFNQKTDGLKDRDSIGTELRYLDNRTSVFSMIDYDLLDDKINVLQLYANYIFDQRLTLYLNGIIRKSHELATLDELKKKLNLEQIYQLARERTADTQTVTFGGTQLLNTTFQLTTDITVSHIDSTPATPPSALIPAGVPGTEEMGPDYYISTQLVGNSLLMKYDTNILGIRYHETDPSDTVSFIVNSRFPIGRKWRINPRLQYDIRKQSDGRKQKKIRAILKTDYRYLNRLRFDFEIGYDDTSVSNTAIDLDNSNLYFSLGYRWDF